MATYQYDVPKSLRLDTGTQTFEVRAFHENPLAEKLAAVLNRGQRPCDQTLDIERDIPQSLVREFLLRSREIKDWSIAVAGSSIRDLLLGREDFFGDIDIAVGRLDGQSVFGMHEDLFKDAVNGMRRFFEVEYHGRMFADMIHFNSPHALMRQQEGRWIFKKAIGAAQYTQDYFGLTNKGEVVDPYGGVKDMLDGLTRLDYKTPSFLEDNPSMDPESPTFSKGHSLSYNTVTRGLFPKYKWGHRFHADTEAELVSHTPWFYCTDYELEMLSRLSVWAPGAIEYVSDLKRYHLMDGLKEAASSDERVKTLTASGAAKERFIRAGKGVKLDEGDIEGVKQSERIERFLESLGDRFRKPLQHELGL
jgi:hypothetical protein